MRHLGFKRLGVAVFAVTLLHAGGRSHEARAEALAAVAQADAVATTYDSPPERCVFLLHGLLMSQDSMNYLDERLSDGGFTSTNYGYRSRSWTLEQSADSLHERIEEQRARNPNSEINLVTHSMGGIVARYYLTKYEPQDFGVLIQIAPPNQGSEKADVFANYFFYRMLYGRNGLAMQTDRTKFRETVGTPDYTIGIIAGGTGDEEGFSESIEGDDDGTISVPRTMLPNMTDHIVLRHTHAFIMRKREVADQVLHFLREGRFRRDTGVLYPPVPGTIAAAE